MFELFTLQIHRKSISINQRNGKYPIKETTGYGFKVFRTTQLTKSFSKQVTYDLPNQNQTPTSEVDTTTILFTSRSKHDVEVTKVSQVVFTSNMSHH